MPTNAMDEYNAARVSEGAQIVSRGVLNGRLGYVSLVWIDDF